MCGTACHNPFDTIATESADDEKTLYSESGLYYLLWQPGKNIQNVWKIALHSVLVGQCMSLKMFYYEYGFYYLPLQTGQNIQNTSARLCFIPPKCLISAFFKFKALVVPWLTHQAVRVELLLPFYPSTDLPHSPIQHNPDHPAKFITLQTKPSDGVQRLGWYNAVKKRGFLSLVWLRVHLLDFKWTVSS